MPSHSTGGGATSPRLLLVPALTELEWQVKPVLERWADVASYDAPGVGKEPPVELPARQAVVERGLTELGRRRWTGCVLVADEWGVPSAVALATQRPDLVRGMALGHACLSYRTDGERPPVRAQARAALGRLASLHSGAFAHHVRQMTLGAYDERTVKRYLDRVPRRLIERYYGSFERVPPAIGEQLRGIDLPLLLVEHVGCLQFTEEGYADAVAAFPHARTASTAIKPSVSPEFAQALRDFCNELSWDPGLDTGAAP